MPFPQFTPTVPVFVRELARKHGDATLIVLDDRRLSFRDADALSAKLARGLLARGVGKGTRVGLLMPNGPDWLVAWLAATRIGAVLVPLNTFFQTREVFATAKSGIGGELLRFFIKGLFDAIDGFKGL